MCVPFTSLLSNGIFFFFFKQKEDIDSSIAGLIIDCYKNVKEAYEADRTLKRQISIHDEEKSDLSYCEVSKKKKKEGRSSGWEKEEDDYPKKMDCGNLNNKKKMFP